MSDHQYFTVNTSRGEVVMSFQDAPQKTETGTSHSLKCPAFIVSGFISGPEEFAIEVAKVLNENAHRFFDSATPSP